MGVYLFGVPGEIPPVIQPLLAHTARSLVGCPSATAKNAAPQRFLHAATKEIIINHATHFLK